ncbi:hypothetical protein GCM10010499_20040 [Streptomyces thermoviolaceus subsp. apingens]|nr:hypothetical protein GCM10010499_20040 [Streptomyces thermoviolaceus subsp. apingens]
MTGGDLGGRGALGEQGAGLRVVGQVGGGRTAQQILVKRHGPSLLDHRWIAARTVRHGHAGTRGRGHAGTRERGAPGARTHTGARRRTRTGARHARCVPGPG